MLSTESQPIMKYSQDTNEDFNIENIWYTLFRGESKNSKGKGNNC